jgi:hypothetical protein
MLCAPLLSAGDAPAWMHAAASSPLPSYDEKTDAVLLYSETNVTVVSTDKIRTHVREAYKILRPSGRDRGTVYVYFNPHRKLSNYHGWCIPAQGKDYEVKDKDALDMSPPIQYGELVSDLKARVLRIPAPDPGNVIGYEYDIEEQTFFLQDLWYFQESDPVRESHYSLQIPAGWEYKASWLNHAAVKEAETGSSHVEWVVRDVAPVRKEPDMPPLHGVSGLMIVSFFPVGGTAKNNEFSNWQSMGMWYGNLMSGRTEASEDIKKEVATLTASKPDVLQKMNALAAFVQSDIRYVAIELGIGGWQPHPASDVFSNRYGDCKDKAGLMRSMLHEIGVDSYAVVINHRRGAVTRDTPAHNGFDHIITAIRLPEGVSDPSLVAVSQHAKLGKLLFFDPTDEITPFGQIRGDLQANFGLLVTPDGGELVELPQQPTNMNSIQRTAKFTINTDGLLKGDVTETRVGDRAVIERWELLHEAKKETDRIKPIERLLAGSLSSFQITHASVVNLQHNDQPFGFRYSFESDNYAKNAGELLLVRPRVLGIKSESFLETKEPRKFPIEFEGPTRDTDTFEIAIPNGYVADDVPSPVDADYKFASYHSKTEVSGGVIRYTRTFEVKELSVPVEKADEVKKFYRIIAGDERNTVVLKSAAK